MPYVTYMQRTSIRRLNPPTTIDYKGTGVSEMSPIVDDFLPGSNEMKSVQSPLFHKTNAVMLESDDDIKQRLV